MTTSVVLFTCDLRLHDHPPLRAALAGGREVVPLFVRDRAVERAGFRSPHGPPNCRHPKHRSDFIAIPPVLRRLLRD